MKTMENTNAAGTDKRHSPRVRYQFRFRYRVIPGSAAFRNAAVQDVSQSGFRFRAQEFLPRQAGIILEMDIPGTAPVRSLAKAVWVRERPSDEGYEVGGMFIEPPHEARTTLSRLVSGK